MKKIVLAGGAGIALTVSLLIFVVNLFSSQDSKAEAAAILRRAEDTLAQQQLEPGQVLHGIQRTYFRYGPVADRIMENPLMGPEATTNEYWTEIGQDGQVLRYHATARDEQGNIIQENIFDGKQVTQRDKTGAVKTVDVPPGAQAARPVGEVQAENMRRYQGLLSQGTAVVIGKGDFNGRPTTIIRWRVAAQSPTQNGQSNQGYTVPYDQDLKPRGRTFTVEFDKETFTVYRVEQTVIDATGTAHLIHSVDTLAYEVLDPSQVPSDAFELN